jgi:hypothetical protein
MKLVDAFSLVYLDFQSLRIDFDLLLVLFAFAIHYLLFFYCAKSKILLCFYHYSVHFLFSFYRLASHPTNPRTYQTIFYVTLFLKIPDKVKVISSFPHNSSTQISQYSLFFIRKVQVVHRLSQKGTFDADQDGRDFLQYL